MPETEMSWKFSCPLWHGFCYIFLRVFGLAPAKKTLMKTAVFFPLLLSACLCLPSSAYAAGPGRERKKTPVRKEKTVKPKTKTANEKSWIPEVLAQKSFGIEITRMFTPGGIVSLSTPALFMLKSGKMQANLPYVGRFSAPNLAIAYKRTINIDNPAIDYSLSPTRRGFRVKYRIYQVGENFDVELRVDKNGYTTVYIYSSIRSDIRYSGTLKRLRF